MTTNPTVARSARHASVMQTEILGSSVSRDELMHLSRQLSSFVRAGVPLIEAVRILEDETRNSRLEKVLADVANRLRQGERLADALNSHPRVFPAYYRAIMRSAELTGRLDVVLEQLARYLERELEARRKISSALTYPLVIAVMSVVTVVILAGFVLPKFKVFFANLNADLPVPTRILLAVTDFFVQWWWAVLIGLAFVIFGGQLVLATRAGKFLRDRVVLRLPVIGPTVRVALVERFCRVLASMAAAGVALPDALKVASQSLRNRVFTRALDGVGEAMLRGEGLARPLASVRLFPSTATRMIRVGEETGTLPTQLELTAKHYETELDHRLKRLTALFEPAMIIAMGLLVGFVAIAMVSAMYGVFGQVDV
jgi:type IV pilus assembly protein PilC